MKRPFRLDVLLIVVVPLIDSLGVFLAHASENGNFAGLVDIGGGRKMYLKCSDRGSPAVVLVGGLRASAEDWSISDKSKPTLFTDVGKFTSRRAADFGYAVDAAQKKAQDHLAKLVPIEKHVTNTNSDTKYTKSSRNL
jgi:hypothetical protein